MNKGKKLTMDDLEVINFPYYYNLVKEGKMKRKEVEGLLFNGNGRRYGRYKNVMEGKPAKYRERVLSKALRFYDGNNNLISKQCTTCGQVKDINEFSKNKKHSDGYMCRCKECVGKKSLECKHRKYENDPDYYKKRNDKYRDKINERARDRYWNRGGKERISKYNKEHREEKNERRRYKYHNDENYKSRCRIKDSERRAIKKGIRGSYTQEQWKQCLEYFDYKDAYTGLPMTIESVDHIIPINKNGTNTIENLVPCEKSVNSTKQDKDLWEWYSKQNYFSWERYLKICMWIIKNL